MRAVPVQVRELMATEDSMCSRRYRSSANLPGAPDRHRYTHTPLVKRGQRSSRSLAISNAEDEPSETGSATFLRVDTTAFAGFAALFASPESSQRRHGGAEQIVQESRTGHSLL